MKKTTEEFIKKAKEIHGDRYDYSKTNYINNKTNVKIICLKHGEFSQTPSNHFKKYGCHICSGKIMNTTSFIEKANKIHNDTYNYSKVIYIDSLIKVIIICPKHGEFLQTPKNHLKGHVCNKCSKNSPCLSAFIKKAKEIHGDRYDYSKTNYINNKKEIIIMCPEHGEFSQIPNNHLEGTICKKCYLKTITYDSQKFISKAKEIHGDRYDYSKIEYINSKIRVSIICKKHGEFKQIANDHLYGSGCPRCCNRVSKSCNKWLDDIENKLGYKIEREVLIVGFRVDGFDIKTNIVYEYYGNFWHGNPKIYNPNDINPKIHVPFGKLYQQTLLREDIIRSAGYNVVTKWGV